MDLRDNEINVDDGIHIDDEVHVVVQFPNRIPSENGKRKKAGNFSIDEDIILVSAWLNTSMDAVNGTDQKSKTFWGRITALYNENIGPNHPKRSEISINNRWHTSQKAVNKFQGCFSQIETRNSSGTTMANMIIEAKQMFTSIHGGNFTFEHCWNILRTQPKWMTRSSLSSKKRLYASCSPAVDLDPIDLENNTTPYKQPDNIERPIGKKAAKEALKKGKGKENVGDMLADWKDYRLELHENKLKMQEEKMKIFSMESEKNMMIEKDKIDLENKRLDLEANKFLIESENNVKIEKDKIDLENKKIELEAKKFFTESENNAKIEKDKVDVEKKKIELEAKKIRHQQVQQEMNIVLMDTSNLDAEQRNFIDSLRAEILGQKFE